MIDMLAENPAEMSYCEVRACKSKEAILKSWGGRIENKEGKEEGRDMERKAGKGKDGYKKEMKERENGEKVTPIFCPKITKNGKQCELS